MTTTNNYVSKFENQNVSFTEVAWLAANAFAKSLRLPQLLICLQHIAVHDLKFAMTFRVWLLDHRPQHRQNAVANSLFKQLSWWTELGQAAQRAFPNSRLFWDPAAFLHEQSEQPKAILYKYMYHCITVQHNAPF